jgi:hypothetical protein
MRSFLNFNKSLVPTLKNPDPLNAEPDGNAKRVRLSALGVPILHSSECEDALPGWDAAGPLADA